MPLSKVKENISMGSDLETSKALVKLMKDSEEEYQSGISENYQVKLLPWVLFQRRELIEYIADNV